MPSGVYKRNNFIPWNKGLTKETSDKVRKMGIATSIGKRGIKFTEEHRENISKGLPKGKNHHNWKGGVTSPIIKRCNRAWWKELRKKVYERDNYICRNCGKKCYGRDKQCHHITAEKLGGLDTMSNLITLCRACHISIDVIQKYGGQETAKIRKEEKRLRTIKAKKI